MTRRIAVYQSFMSNLSFEISHFTGKTTRIVSALQGLFSSSDWYKLKFRWRIWKGYIINMSRTFLWNNYFWTNVCFVICHLTAKCIRSFANFVRLLSLSSTRIPRNEVTFLPFSRVFRTVNPEVVGSIPAKTQKTKNSNLYGFELFRPSRKVLNYCFKKLKQSSFIDDCFYYL